MDNGILPTSYQPVFRRMTNNNIQHTSCQVPVSDAGKWKPDAGAVRLQQEVKQMNENMRLVVAIGRDIALVLKCLVGGCVIIIISILYGIFRNACSAI